MNPKQREQKAHHIRTHMKVSHKTGCWNGPHPANQMEAWEVFIGPVPEGHCVTTRCDNPECVNPSHLHLVKVAVPDTGACKPKIGMPEAREIRDRYARGGISQRKLGDEYGISQGQVSRIVRQVDWPEPAGEE